MSCLNISWSSTIVAELIQQGCGIFCVAPGSRSTPLVLAVDSIPSLKTMVCHDERSLGFFALGFAKATQKPAVIITTSGTAVANLYPAIVEASMDRVPLIILSADRPAELRGSAANQTIDQVRMFGNYARFFVDIPPATQDITQSRLIALVRQACAGALAPIPGPVQINCQFREPLC